VHRLRRNIVIFVISAAAAFSLGYLAGGAGRSPASAASAGVPSGNGDVNADGTINIADPVYLLIHLFQGGDAPVAIEVPPAEIGHPVDEVDLGILGVE